MYWLPADRLAFEYGLLGAVCIMGGLIFFIVSVHWRAERIGLWWVWGIAALIAVALGCCIIGKG